jgi:hypothetical protein
MYSALKNCELTRSSRRANRIACKGPLAQKSGQPCGHRREGDKQDEQQKTHENVGNHSAENIAHGDLRGCYAFHGHEQQAVRRQHRVFFADEATAMKAGYRSFRFCMLEKYRV